jgi:MoaA/NifB/PqqE/SkfB family radical SAM enzyme
MPHSACNCRCVMCDIWKDNQNLKQLSEADVHDLMITLKKLGTQQVLMSGGEALLNPNFFRLCEILKKENMKISLLSTGLTLKKMQRPWLNGLMILLYRLTAMNPFTTPYAISPKHSKKWLKVSLP